MTNDYPMIRVQDSDSYVDVPLPTKSADEVLVFDPLNREMKHVDPAKEDVRKIFKLVEPAKSVVLFQKAFEFDFHADNDGSPRELTENMYNTMQAFNGLGLAAPQVGIPIAMFVMRLQKVDSDVLRPSMIAVFNPQIISTSTTRKTQPEGCLSYPGLYLKIPRADMINVQYQNEFGATLTQTFGGYEARCFLHEYDHLQGTVFTKLVGPTTLMMAKKKQDKLLKQIHRGQRK